MPMQGRIVARGTLAGEVTSAGALQGTLEPTGVLTGGVVEVSALAGTAVARRWLRGLIVNPLPLEGVWGRIRSRSHLVASVAMAGVLRGAILALGLVGRVELRGLLAGRVRSTGALIGLLTTDPGTRRNGSASAGPGDLASTVVLSTGSATITLPPSPPLIAEPYARILLVAWQGTIQFPGGVLVTETNPGAGIFTMNYAPPAGKFVTVLYQKAF